MKHIVVIPDLQIPLHDKELVDKFIRFIGDYNPHGLACVGDFTDSTQLSKWTLGMSEQYDGNLQRDFDMSTDILRRIREETSVPFHFSRSNHDDRLFIKIKKFAPELESLRDLTIQKQLHMEELDIQWHDELYNLAPGWLLGHGDEGSLSQIPGKTAYGLALQTGMNFVCGHTHRLGVHTTSHGYNGQTIRTVQGMEVGNMMDLTQASYLKGGKANWQQGFGILHIADGGFVYPEIIPVINGNFVVDGRLY